MIIFFTETGNSQHLAELLAKQLGDATIDAAAKIKMGKHPRFVSDSPYIFVSPVYAWRLPRVFEIGGRMTKDNTCDKIMPIATKQSCDGLFGGVSIIPMPTLCSHPTHGRAAAQGGARARHSTLLFARLRHQH